MSSSLAILRRPQVTPILASALLGRLPSNAMGLLLALTARHIGLSFAATGLTTGAYAIAVGVSAPPLGRLIDRLGQRPVLLTCGISSGLVWLAIAALPMGAPGYVLGILGVLGGLAVPPLGSSTRALWDDLLPDPNDRHAILSLEIALQEAVFALGPLVLVTLLASISLRLSMVAVAAAVFFGTAVFTSRPASRARGPLVHPRSGGALGALGNKQVRALAFVALALGLALGAISLACVAYGDDVGSQGVTGVLVAATGIGSMAGGFWASRYPAPRRPGVRLVRLVAGFALATALPAVLAAVEATPSGFAATAALTVLLFAGGTMLAPGSAVLFGLMGTVTAPDMRTESYTWLAAGTTGGVAAGSALGGIAAGLGGTAAAFGVGAVVAGAAAIVTRWATAERRSPARPEVATPS
jgi:MFS family permease